jgi:peroxiredoxin
MKFCITIITCVLLSVALQGQTAFSLKLKDTAGKEYDLSELKKNNGSVLVFLSPECPICQKYTLTLNQIEKEFLAQGIKFYGIFPGVNFKTRDINKFAKKYGITMPLLLDPSYVLTKSVAATVTPEVMLFNADGVVQYDGKVDNWFEDIGKRRTVITEYYLKDALSGLLNGTEIKVKRTTPVGCFIF